MQRNPDHYRKGVGIILLNDEGKVFTGQRLDKTSEAWQMPQGGIDAGETPETAMWREMMEEIGTDKAEIIHEIPDWLFYDLPPELAAKLWNGQYKGQMQKWFLLKFTGEDKDINLNTPIPEFATWKWSNIEDLDAMIVPFKRDLYKQLLELCQHKLAV